jgi:signal-transduction protein with cAMP-binding, CBS, and nucleotidyltransferase domain
MGLTGRDIMTPSVVTLERGASVAEATKVMAERSVGSLIVGILTETDIVRLLSKGGDPRTHPVEELMSSPLFSTAPETDAISIANTMTMNHIKKMPVLERQQIVGMITQTDIVKYVLRMISELHEQFSKGEIGANEFAKRSQEIFNGVPKLQGVAKEWHMLCKACANQFLADEVNGKLAVNVCPRCGGEITYDLNPPI